MGSDGSFDFADSICLLSQTYDGVKGKRKDLGKEARVAGLKINASKRKLMKNNIKSLKVLKVQEENIEEMRSSRTVVV